MRDAMIQPERRTKLPPALGWLGLCGFLVITVFLLWEEHRAHLLGALPWVLLLLCPVLHLFVLRGHGERRGARHSAGHERKGQP